MLSLSACFSVCVRGDALGLLPGTFSKFKAGTLSKPGARGDALPDGRGDPRGDSVPCILMGALSEARSDSLQEKGSTLFREARAKGNSCAATVFAICSLISFFLFLLRQTPTATMPKTITNIVTTTNTGVRLGPSVSSCTRGTGAEPVPLLTAPALPPAAPVPAAEDPTMPPDPEEPEAPVAPAAPPLALAAPPPEPPEPPPVLAEPAPALPPAEPAEPPPELPLEVAAVPEPVVAQGSDEATVTVVVVVVGRGAGVDAM